MNRRSFFTSLGAVAAACAAPAIFIPKFEPVRWKVIKPKSLGVVLYGNNPAYAQARYEIVLALNPVGMPLVYAPWPVRFNTTDDQGKPISIPPFIEYRMT